MDKSATITKSQGVIRDVYSHLCPIADEIEKLRALVLADTTTPFDEWRDRCVRTFKSFHRCVQEHIDYEASVGVHLWLTGLSPALGGRSREMEGEHERLLAECGRIASQVATMSASDRAAERDLVCGLENVIALFRRHTASELEMVHEALGEDPSSESAADMAWRPCLHDGLPPEGKE